MASQAGGLFLLGTSGAGRGLSVSILVLHNLLAIGCAGMALARARNVAAVFWLLYLLSQIALLVPTAAGAYDLVFQHSTFSAATWRVLYCLYGAPLLMILFLPSIARERVKYELFLDLFEVGMVVGLIFSVFFLLPVQEMLPAAALVRNISLSNLENLFLLLTFLVRLGVTREADFRRLLIRLGTLVAISTLITYIGNWVDLHDYRILSAWFDIGWAVPYAAAGLLACTWNPPAAKLDPLANVPVRFISLLANNLALAALLLSIGLLMQHRRVEGRPHIAGLLAASLLAFILRFTMTQFHQQQEIARRKEVEGRLRSETAFLQAQTNSTVDGILVVNPEGRKLLQNRRFVELFQIPPNVLEQDQDTTTLKHVLGKAKDPEGFLQTVRYLYDHREVTSRDEIEFKDGMVLDRYSAPVLGSDNSYYGRIWVFRDVTRRKQDEALLRRLSSAVEQSPVSVIMTDLGGRIIYVNRAFVECTGYSPDEVMGRNPRILQSGFTPAEVYKRLWADIRGGKEWRGEFQNRKKNGNLYWEQAVIRPITDENGVISHFLALKEDITERRRMEAQLQRAQKLEAIGQLAAGIAHEINTPLQFIGDNTRFALDSWMTLNELRQAEGPASGSDIPGLNPAADREEAGFLRREVPKALQQSLEGIESVRKIVMAMKKFSHPGSDKKEPADLNQAIETTVTVARNEWKYVADLEADLSPDIGPVLCHVNEINQVLLNLMVNAAHAIAQVVGDGSKGKGKITIQSRRDANGVEIRLHDTGCGVPKEIQGRIFDPFFTTKEVGRGTGQGLALAHAVIVKRHGGTIWFDTEIGKGTTFHIRLPALSGATSPDAV